MKRLSVAFTAFLCFVSVSAPGTRAQAAESASVAIAGRALITYLPFTLADRLGYFKDEGLTLHISDFKGGSQSIEALVGGSADLAIGAYEHTLILQPKGVGLKAVALFNKSYGAVIALRPALAKKYRSPKDLKGLKFGTTAPGSSGALAISLLLAKGGLPPSAISVIGIGGGPGAVAAAEAGELDGVSEFDPVITQLVHDGAMVPIVDTRTKRGMDELYGGYIAASSVLTTPAFIAAHRQAVQAFATAIVRALKWMHTASVDQIAKAVPTSYYGPDPALYKEALERSRETFTPDGLIPLAAATNTYRVLAKFGPLSGGQKVDIPETFDNSFAKHH
jgi:NitT/TauT family transport system substrate-binding protein